MSQLTYEFLKEHWLYGATLRELAKVLGMSQMAVHRHVHKSVALPSKLGPICPICHRKLRRKSKEVRLS